MRASNLLCVLLCAFLSVPLMAEEESKGVLVSGRVEDGDTVMYGYLPTLHVYPPMQFKNSRQEKFYWRTVRDVKKTLPYSKLIARLLNEYHAEMENMPEKEKKAFMKTKEKELYAAYEPILKQLTLRQGKMLIRLVDRECDRTSFEIIKELRGGFRAFFWQMFAKMLGADLKATFDESKEENQIINRIINMVESGQL